jgi:hypothetical protein
LKDKTSTPSRAKQANREEERKRRSIEQERSELADDVRYVQLPS